MQKSRQADHQTGPAANPRVQALYIYPLKSCRGIELDTAEVIRTGFKYDRLFTFAQLVKKKSSRRDNSGSTKVDSDGQWEFITQRECPKLALLRTELWIPESTPNSLTSQASEHRTTTNKEQFNEDDGWAANGGCLTVRFSYQLNDGVGGLSIETVSIHLPLVPSSLRAKIKGYTHENVSVWIDCPQGINMTAEIEPAVLAKLKHFLGLSNQLALFRSDENKLRKIIRSLPEHRSTETFSVGFADAFPLHLLNIASVEAIDAELPASAAVKDNLDPLRFRANILVDGCAAYEEDTWKRIRMGCEKSLEETNDSPAEYHVACRVARCKLPNVDQETGIKDRNEPDTTLRRTRKVDKGAYPHPCLGMAMMPLFYNGALKVGDKIEVLEAGEHVYEKMYS